MGMHETRNVKILVELHKELKIIAAKKSIKICDLFNEIVREWIIKQDQKQDEKI